MPTCPQCGEENPEHAKFCNECAAPLSEQPPPPALAAAAPERARALLAEIEQTPGAHETPYYARQLAAMAVASA